MPSAASGQGQAALPTGKLCVSCTPMDERRHLLLLGGSGEARQIADALAGSKTWRVTASLPFAPRAGAALAVPTRTGAFASAGCVLSFLAAENVDAVLDATHPFSENVSDAALRAARERDVPIAQVLRPPWVVPVREGCVEVPHLQAAAARLQPGDRVFTNIGRDLLPELSGATPARFFARHLGRDPDPAPFDNVTYVAGTPPFSVADERALFERLRIDVLLTKNTGSSAARSKVDAAVAMGLRVVLLARPAPANGHAFETVEDALGWVAQL